MTTGIVENNCDPQKMGRILIENKWYSPICCSKDGQTFVPNIGEKVVLFETYYIGVIPKEIL